jgi:hypothetical protein
VLLGQDQDHLKISAIEGAVLGVSLLLEKNIATRMIKRKKIIILRHLSALKIARISNITLFMKTSKFGIKAKKIKL